MFFSWKKIIQFSLRMSLVNSAKGWIKIWPQYFGSSSTQRWEIIQLLKCFSGGRTAANMAEPYLTSNPSTNHSFLSKNLKLFSKWSSKELPNNNKVTLIFFSFFRTFVTFTFPVIPHQRIAMMLSDAVCDHITDPYNTDANDAVQKQVSFSY